MNVLIFGSSGFGRPAFERLAQESDLRIVGVVTQPPKIAGRNGQLTATVIHRWAAEAGMPVLPLDTLKTPTAVDEIEKLSPDLCLVASYGLLLPPAILAIPTHGCINIHASLLPRYRGASPIIQAILSGDHETGVTFMLMDADLDTGPILDSFSCAIDYHDTAGTLENKLSRLSAACLVPCLRSYLRGALIPTPQHGHVTYAQKITSETAHLTWDSSVDAVRHIRAFDPSPGAWNLWQGRRVKFYGGFDIPGSPSHDQPGTIKPYPKKPAWAVQCRTGVFVPQEVQLEGKRRQPAESFLAGYRSLIGSVLA